MTGVVPEACPAGVTHTISLLLRLEDQEIKGTRCYIQRLVMASLRVDCGAILEGLDWDLTLTETEIDTKKKKKQRRERNPTSPLK